MEHKEKKKSTRRKRGLKKITGPLLTTLPGSIIAENVDELPKPEADHIRKVAEIEEEAFEVYRKKRNPRKLERTKGAVRASLHNPSFPGLSACKRSYTQFLIDVLHSSSWRMVTYIAREAGLRARQMLAAWESQPIVDRKPIVEKQINIYLHNWMGTPKELWAMNRQSKVLKRERDFSIRGGAEKTLKVVVERDNQGKETRRYYGVIRNNRTIVNIDVFQIWHKKQIAEVWVADRNQNLLDPIFAWGGNIQSHGEIEPYVAEVFNLLYHPLEKPLDGLAAASREVARKGYGW